MLDYSEIALRLTVAMVAGAALGLNRELHGKAMGIRTLGLVGLGSAVAVIAVDGDGVSRVMQGIVTGIGFLGAGVIVRPPSGSHVRGLTTAACAWSTAALGMLCGVGAWPAVAIALPLMFILLVLGGPLEKWVHAQWGSSGSDASD
ncbi:MAG: MgtC/SapB family protein [Pseudolabrys sp.]